MPSSGRPPLALPVASQPSCHPDVSPASRCTAPERDLAAVTILARVSVRLFSRVLFLSFSRLARPAVSSFRRTFHNHCFYFTRTVVSGCAVVPTRRTRSFSGNSCAAGFLLTESDLLLHLRVLLSALLESGKMTFNYLCCFL